MDLYTWEYEGKQYFGGRRLGAKRDTYSYFPYPVDRQSFMVSWSESEITNLRPAKVVDKDAVVIDEATLRDIKGLINEAKSYGEGDLWEIAKRVSASLFPTPPVLEPKGFGAIVEAGWYQRGVENKPVTWTFDGEAWCYKGNTRGWQDLIYPTILSEGL